MSGSIEKLTEAVNNLTALLQAEVDRREGLKETAPAPKTKEEPKEEVEEEKPKKKAAPKQAKKTPAKKKEVEEKSSEVSKDDLRVALNKFVNTEGVSQDDAREIMSNNGGTTIGKLPEENYAKVVADLNEALAKLG